MNSYKPVVFGWLRAQRPFGRWTIAISLVLLVLITPMLFTLGLTRSDRYDLARTPVGRVPDNRVAIVFGAGILPDGTPTPYLRDRVKTAVVLYRAHRVVRLLMSGDNGSRLHDEPAVMARYAESLGVPATAIVRDDAGFSTYDSCYRARHIFQITAATLVSQGYHLPRAIETCRGLGIRSIGVAAVHPARDYTLSYLLREVLSTDKMLFQLVFRPQPMVLGHVQPL